MTHEERRARARVYEARSRDKNRERRRAQGKLYANSARGQKKRAAWEDANPDKLRAAYKRYDAKRKSADPAAYRQRHTQSRLRQYGATLEWYEKTLAAQGGLCAICRQPETSSTRWGTPKTLAVDHCHRTGKLRGLLCHTCNVALGLMKENPSRFRAALRYLEQNNDGSGV